jgi:hypothetical protein
MPKRVLYTCAWCGQYIYYGELCKVRSNPSGKVDHYHYDPETGMDCLAAEENAIKIMREMDEATEEDFEIDKVVGRGID